MANTKLTVLMAMYNGGDFLRQSIQSVLDQSFQEFEFLIVNDCSTDNSVEVIESFNDKRISIIHNKENIGQTCSLNVGLSEAKGGLIARIDADDVALPLWLDSQVRFINDSPHLSVVSSHVVAIDRYNNVKKLYMPSSVYNEMAVRSLVATPINHVGSIMRRSDVLKYGGYDKRYKTAADYDLWGKMLRGGLKIGTNPLILMAIREHEQSLSRLGQVEGRGMDEIIEIAGKNIRHFVDSQLSDDEIRIFCRAHYDEASITESEFHQSLVIAKNIYMSLDASIKINDNNKARYLKKRWKTAFMKRIFAEIGGKSYSRAKNTAREAICKFGPFSIFSVLWVASLFGGILLKRAPQMYYSVLKYKACRKMGGKLGYGAII